MKIATVFLIVLFCVCFFFSGCSFFSSELSDVEKRRICINIAETRFSQESITIVNIQDDYCRLEVEDRNLDRSSSISSRLIGKRLVNVNYKTNELIIVPRR